MLAKHVDIGRYSGRRYVIANIPYFPERGNMGAYVEYSLLPDGRIADVYHAHEMCITPMKRASTLR